jgi:RNA polymerase sigma-70 factor (ECF subfamily)
MLSWIAVATGEMGAAPLEDFDSVVRLYRPKIFRYVLASLREHDTAENLTQECFAKAYQARARFRGEASVNTWLMQIAVNLVRDHCTNSRLMFWKRTMRTSVDVSVAGEWIVDRRLSPEAAAAARQQVAAIWVAAEKLPERQKTVFLLRFVEDMEILEISAVTGMAEGTVKSHMSRALQAVRQKMEVKQIEANR